MAFREGRLLRWLTASQLQARWRRWLRGSALAFFGIGLGAVVAGSYLHAELTEHCTLMGGPEVELFLTARGATRSTGFLAQVAEAQQAVEVLAMRWAEAGHPALSITRELAWAVCPTWGRASGRRAD